MKNNLLISLGAIIGLVGAFAVVMNSNTQIKEEIVSQTKTVLKSTRRIVNHYSGISRMLTNNDDTIEISPTELEWRDSIEKAKEHE